MCDIRKRLPNLEIIVRESPNSYLRNFFRHQYSRSHLEKLTYKTKQQQDHFSFSWFISSCSDRGLGCSFCGPGGGLLLELKKRIAKTTIRTHGHEPGQSTTNFMYRTYLDHDFALRSPFSTTLVEAVRQLMNTFKVDGLTRALTRQL